MDCALSVCPNEISLARNLPPVALIQGLVSPAMAAVELILTTEGDTNFVRS